MPSKKRSARAMPADSSSSTQGHPTRPPLRGADVCVGCIVWLPDIAEASHVKPFRLGDKALNTEGYYHPVVILGITPRHGSTQTSDLEVCFAILTTFRGVSLSQFGISKDSLPPSIAIVDKVNPGIPQYLQLEDEKRLRKQSYVRIEHVYETSISNLRSYAPDNNLPAYHLRLDKESYLKLMSILSLEAQDYPATDTLKRARRTRKHASVPIHAPTSATSQNASHPPDPAPNTPTTIINASSLRIPSASMSASDPIAARNFCNRRCELDAPEHSTWTPASQPSKARPATEPRDDTFVDLEACMPPGPRLPPRIPYNTAKQLSPPSVPGSKRRGGSCWGGFAAAVVFWFFGALATCGQRWSAAVAYVWGLGWRVFT